MSSGLPLLARCQLSIFACNVSRTASSSRFFEARSRIMAERPAQNASGEIPVPGVASLAMKSNRMGAIFNPWASIRFMMGFFSRETAATRHFQGDKWQKSPAKGLVRSPFSAKAGALRRPPVAHNEGGERSDIGGEVDEFVEQNAGPCQHPLDLVG